MTRIVIVDDNPGARAFVVASLRHLGHELREVEPTCLFEVLRLLHETPPDLLLTDLIMPACPGQTLIRACREDPHLKDLKILLLSAHADVQLAHFLQELGQTRYITKPVTPHVLAECVQHLLEGDAPGSPVGSPGEGHIAIVDDSRLTRTYLANCLRAGGFESMEIVPLTLGSVLDALKLAKPRLLLLDYQMPHFTGDALVQTLREDPEPWLQNLPILMVTSHADPDLEGRLRPFQNIEILQKPIQAEVLLDSIHTVLEIQKGHPSFP